jgi:hypothetical protein
MGHAHIPAEKRDLAGFPRGLGAQAVIDRCRLDAAGSGRMSQQQQGNTVRTAGYRQTESSLGRQ